MEQHERLIHAFIRRQGSGVIGYEEALQAGRIGLWRAIGGYDVKRGTAFSTYAWVAIYRWIQRRAKEVQREQEVKTKVIFPNSTASRQSAFSQAALSL